MGGKKSKPKWECESATKVGVKNGKTYLFYEETCVKGKCTRIKKCEVINGKHYDCYVEHRGKGCSCIAGDTKIATPNNNATMVRDLSPGDFVRGKSSPDGEFEWCKVLTKQLASAEDIAHGPTTASHGVVTGVGTVAPARYLREVGDGSFTAVNLTDGGARIIDTYSVVSDCPLIATADNKTLMTALSDVLLDDEAGVEVSFADYVSVWQGLVDLTNAPELLPLWNPNSYHDSLPLPRRSMADSNTSLHLRNTSIMSKLPALATSVLACKANHTCERFEAVADDIVTSHLDPALAKVVKEKYPTPHSFSAVLVQEQHVTINNTTVNLGPNWFFIAFMVLLGVLVLGCSVAVLSWVKKRRPKEATTIYVGKAVPLPADDFASLKYVA